MNKKKLQYLIEKYGYCYCCDKTYYDDEQDKCFAPDCDAERRKWLRKEHK